MTSIDDDVSDDLINNTSYSDISNMHQNRCANKLFKISSSLTNHLFFAHKEISRIFLPLAHRKYWGVIKSDSKALEVFARVIWFIPMAIIGSIGSPFALVGIIFRIIASHFNPKGFIFENHSINKNPSDNNKVGFWNIGAPGGGEAYKNVGVCPPEERIQKIIQLIHNSSNKLICLAEVYDRSIADRLVQELRKKGYNQFIHTQGGWGFCPSGHFAAIKGEFLKQPEFIPFSTKGQFFVNKGFSVYRAQFNEKEYTVVQTHLHHSKNDEKPTDEEKEIRSEQVNQIRCYLKKNGSKDVLIIGDLNAKEEEVQKLFPEAKRLVTGPTSATSYLVNFVATGEKPKLKEFAIDHALVLNNENFDIDCIDTYDVENPQNSLSDHRLLDVSIE